MTDARTKWFAELSEDERAAEVEREQDERFLDLAETIQIGAEAVREKRRLQARLSEVEADRDKWMALCLECDRVRGSILGDLVVGLTSGVLKVDPNVPLPDRLKEKSQ